MGFFGSLLSALPIVGPMVQQSIDAGVQRRNVDRTILANRQLAEYQYSKDLEMWNRQNEYNSPLAQMARLKGAGLNPNLVYGTGAAGATGQAREFPKFNAPTVQYNYQPALDIPGVINQFQEFQVKQAQIDNLRVQNQVYGANASLLTAKRGTEMFRSDLTGFQSAIAREKAYQMQGLFPHQLEYAAGRNRLMETQVEKMMAETDFTKLKTDWFVSNLMAQWVGKAASLFRGGMRGGRFRTPGRQQKLGPYSRSNIDHILRNLGK
jgi:hypothetical protein